MLRVLVVLATAALMAPVMAAPASAQEQGGSESGSQSATPDEGSTTDTGEARERVEQLFERQPVQYQITFPRFEAIVTPAFILNGFFDQHANHWSHGQSNYAFGGEFIIRRIDKFDLVFGVDWADIRTHNDWWLESGKHLVDADWGQNGLSILTFDVAINWITVLKEWWHFYYGVGLGLGIVLGQFLKFDVDPNCITEAGADPFQSTDGRILRNNCFDENGNPRLLQPPRPQIEDRVPPVIPALTLTAGTRFIVDDHWAIQLEVGFKNIYLYAGLELGFIWE